MLASGNLDEIYAQVNTSGTTSYLLDGLNSTVALTSSTGAITANYYYSPYGDTVQTGTATTPYNFTEREYDNGTSQYYYRARYYSPQLGRFISEDPVGLGGGTNFYAYVSGNPISLVDPTGLTPEDIIQIACLAAQLNPDLPVPRGPLIRTANLPPNVMGETSNAPFTSTFTVSSVYAEYLSTWQLIDLYTTIVHESIHLNQPWYERLFDKTDAEAEAYAGAAKRTTPAVIGRIKRGKYGCGCK